MIHAAGRGPHIGRLVRNNLIQVGSIFCLIFQTLLALDRLLILLWSLLNHVSAWPATHPSIHLTETCGSPAHSLRDRPASLPLITAMPGRGPVVQPYLVVMLLLQVIMMPFQILQSGASTPLLLASATHITES